MTCTTCARVLEPGTRFCPACGTRVPPTCGACGTELGPQDRFCRSCGTPVATADAAAVPVPPAPAPAATTPAPSVVHERKVATMLFADLVGFTSLNETTDPELVQALVTRAFDRLSAEVARYEGTLEKFAGDALLAVFGVPMVHEDDAERAVRAALEMQSAMQALAAELRAEGRPELSLRIGIETGEVLVDLGRASGERDRMVTGDPVNTAARLQSVAQPGAIVVGANTYAATRDLVDYEELPPAALKGKALPVAAWRAVAVKARRGGVRPALGMEAPLIGRDEEMALIKETVRRTVADGRPHLVTVIGSAGVGKSRLTWELEKYLDGLPDAYHWRKGRCLAYAQSSFSALADALKSDARIMDDDAPTTAAAKLDARIAELGGAGDDRLAQAARALLAIGAASGLTRDDLFDAWRRYLTLIARRDPLVLVMEDIHWADDGLLDLIESVARWAEGPVLVLCLARHELLERRPSWGGGIPNATTIVLEPLGAGEVEQLVDALLAGGLPADLRARVVALADGNPLFAEELVRMFVDRGVLRYADDHWQLARPVDEVEIPGSIHAVLAARLDALPAAEKRTAQDAAVVGRIFWDALIAHLARQGTGQTADLLRRLRVKELVVPRQPSVLAGAAEFGFRHVLIRDVAYDSLPKRERAAKHLDVARWAEAALAEREEEMVELLAAHSLAALRYDEEFAGPDSDRLRELRARTHAYALRAGRRAEEIGNKDAAARWFRVAVEQARALRVPARDLARLIEDYVAAAQGFEPEAVMQSELERALDLLAGLPERTPDDLQLSARLRALLAVIRYDEGDLPGCRSTLLEGIAMLEDRGPTPGLARLRARLGWSYWRGGPLEQAPAVLRQAIEEARASGAHDVERMALHDLGVALAMLGGPIDGVRLVRESFALAQAANDRTLLRRCWINLPAIMSTIGDRWSDIEPILEEGLTVSRRSMDHGTVAWLANNRADMHLWRGDLAAAANDAEEAMRAAEAIASAYQIASSWWRRGLCRLAAGDQARAAEAFGRVEVSAQDSEPQFGIHYVEVNALLGWRADPVESTRMLAAAMHRPDIAPASVVDSAVTLARMAWRVDDRAVLEEAVAVHRVATERNDGIARALERRWLAALLGDPEVGAAVVRETAQGIDVEAGYGRAAAEAWLDAALLAEAAGGDGSADRERALAMLASFGMAPMLP